MTEQEAYAFVESKLWPDGPVCPRCKGKNAVRLNGKSTRIGVHKCRDCRKPFRVTVGTPLEKSHIPLSIWLEAIALSASKKTGVTVDRLESLGVTRTAAWQMGRRIREGDLVERLNLAK